MTETMIFEERREIPVAAETDVVVIGGGVAGIAAAAAAARNGMRVILIEKSAVLGGLATLGHVCVYMPLDDGLGHKVYGGLSEELLHVCCRYSYNTIPDCWKGGPAKVENPKGRYHPTFNIPACVLALDEFMKDEGVEVVFDTAFCMPIMEGGACKGVIVENKSGRTAYLCRMVVDASGDADVFFRAGAPCEEKDNIVSHWTYEVDLKRIRSREDMDVLHNLQLRWFGLRPDNDNSGSPIPTFYGTTGEGVSDYLKFSRSLVLDYLKQQQGREGYAMMTIPHMAQFRMTRRIRGLAELDLTKGKREEHSVGCVMDCLIRPEEVFEFPYEAIIDREIPNIAAAGRIVSAAERGWGIMRYIPACAMTGQVAGTAAALAVKAGVALQALDVAALQEALAAAGVMIHTTEEIRENVATKRAEGIDDKSDPMIFADTLAYHGHEG